MKFCSTIGLLAAVIHAGAQEHGLRLLVPFYVKPLLHDTPVAGDPPYWTADEVIADSGYYDDMETAGWSGVDISIIINPLDGPYRPDDTTDRTSILYPLYRQRIPALIDAGIQEVLCYVPTGYGTRTDVEHNIDLYVTPGYFTNPTDQSFLCDGIFFDETSAEASEVAKYDGYYSYVQTKFPGGTVVFNTGVTPKDSALYNVGGGKVIITSYENYYDGLPNSPAGGGSKNMPEAPTGGTRAQHSAMIHTVASTATAQNLEDLVKSAYCNEWGNIFITDDSTTVIYGQLFLNPWDEEPSFLFPLLETMKTALGSSCSDACSPNPCSEYGTCNEDGTCTCVEGYTGETCEVVDVDLCSPNPCSEYGICNADGTCTCLEGYYGETCDLELSDMCIALGEMTCLKRSDCCRHTNENKKAKCKKGKCCNKKRKKCKTDNHCCGSLKCQDKRCARL